MKTIKSIIMMSLLIAYANLFANSITQYQLPGTKPVINIKPFIGAGMGFSTYGFGDERKSSDSIFKKSSALGDFSYNISAGMNIMQYLGVLARYSVYGQTKDSAGTTLTANSMAFLIRGILPFDALLKEKTHISLFMDFGYANLHYKFDMPTGNDKSDNKGAFAYDFGAGYNINPNLQVSLQYGFNVTSNVDDRSFLAGMFSSNLSYSF